jgi:hypothetical protein
MARGIGLQPSMSDYVEFLSQNRIPVESITSASRRTIRAAMYGTMYRLWTAERLSEDISSGEKAELDGWLAQQSYNRWTKAIGESS